jgi:polyribonucleotide nucleotidyltransferase
MYLKETISLGGRELSLETGKVAKQADGSVIMQYGDTVVLVAVVGDKKPREGVDFFPLTVEYREQNSSAGRIPGNYFRREGRPTEKEILTSRLIDRPLRPLFQEGYVNETQLVATVISADPDLDPDVIAITGASAALYLSPIPFLNPIAGVRVGLVDGRYIVNPTYEETRESKLNLIVAGSEEAIVMVEAGATIVSEEVLVEALMFGHGEIKKLCRWQREVYNKMSVTKREVVKKEYDAEMVAQIESKFLEDLREALNVSNKSKLESYAAIDALKAGAVDLYPAEETAKRADAAAIFSQMKEKAFRDDILNKRRRPDGRRFSEIRPISIEVGWLPRVHGSALFTRGETQAMVSCTLGTSEDSQFLDNLEKGEIKRRFMLDYNFPPYSVGEVKRMGSPGRREIGHGALARRALVPVLPEEGDFPYVLRIVSDITESNGSSSMASVCGGSLSLFDAGVPCKAAVAGVAMGLVKEGNKYAVLTDIAGAEDHYGDMDFKVAGTREGVTALQMDMKITGINAQILAEALQQAKQGRMFLLDKMDEAITAPQAEISEHAPRILTIHIPTEKIREVIGPGGKMIRSIVEKTGAKIDIEDSGRINIASANLDAANAAIQMIEDLTAEAELGKVYLGKVVKFLDFGAIVEIMPGLDGLLHVSEIAEQRIRDPRDVLRDGQQVLVKVINIDPSGKVKLSRRAALRDDKTGTGGGDEGMIEGGANGGDDDSHGNREERRDREPRDRDRRDHRGPRRR